MKYLPLALILIAFPGCNPKEAPQTSSKKPPDHAFLTEAAQANLAEIDAGRLALAKTGNVRVKEFAQHMVDDHSAANMELRDLAEKKDFKLPETPDDSHLKKVAKLGEISGVDFDRRYMELMVEDHHDAVALFDKNSRKADDADVRAWAAKMLPKLTEHLKMSRDLFAKVSGTTP